MVFKKVFCFPPSLDLLQEFINSSGIPTKVTVFKVSIPVLVILLIHFLVNVLLFCCSCLSIRLLRVPVLIRVRAFDQTPYSNIKLFLDVFSSFLDVEKFIFAIKRAANILQVSSSSCSPELFTRKWRVRTTIIFLWRVWTNLIWSYLFFRLVHLTDLIFQLTKRCTVQPDPPFPEIYWY